jgi:hypothetical protein
MEKPITVEGMRQMFREEVVRLENLFRKLFPSITAFNNPNAHFSPRLLLTLLQNRGSEVTRVDVQELRSLITVIEVLSDKVLSAVLTPTGLEEGAAQEMVAQLQECSARLDQLYAKV